MALARRLAAVPWAAQLLLTFLAGFALRDVIILRKPMAALEVPPAHAVHMESLQRPSPSPTASPPCPSTAAPALNLTFHLVGSKAKGTEEEGEAKGNEAHADVWRPHRYPPFHADLTVEDTRAFIRRNALARENGQSPSRKGPIRICLLTSAIAGPTPSGGVGTAFRALALHLANSVDAGGARRFAVTVLYAAHPWYGEGTAAQWMEHFGRQNVRFVPLVSAASEDYYGPKLLVRAYRAFHFLLQHEAEFDVLTYADHLGNGYFAAMAKRQGLALQSTYIMAQCHSTLRWADSLNARPPKDHNTLAYYHMEQKSVEWADARVSPSLDYLRWYTSDEARFDLSHGLNFVLPNLLHPVPAPVASKVARSCTHFVFFGRLEVRKGLLVFLEAVERLIARTHSEAVSSLALAPSAVAQLRISFVGPDVSVGGEKGSLLIKRRLEHVLPPDKLTLETELTTQRALAYIAQGEATAVLPTLGDNSPYVVLEIVAAGLPLITTSAGGGMELLKLTAATAPFVVAPGDARALAGAMKLALEQGIPTFEAAFPFDQATETYLDLMLAFAAQNSRAGAQGQHSPSNRGPGVGGAPTNAAGVPRILVGITSHNRPDVLTRAVTSLFGQTYPRSHMGIVIEDDASDHTDMSATLDRLESQLSKAALAMAEVHRNVVHRFVAETRNAILQQAADNNFDWACFMDDDDVALPFMLRTYMQVAAQLDVDILTDFSDNYDITEGGQWRLSHRSLAVGNAFAHNFFINNYGKANFCVRPKKALAIGGHHTGSRSASPYVDWGFFTRASLNGLRIEVLPMALYKYAKHSPGSIWYGMTTQPNRYDGHAKMLADLLEVVPPSMRDVLLYCRYSLAFPRAKADGVY